MNASPLVSVIVPFYDRDDYLTAAIESVAAQTYSRYEIIVVDDCSPGRSAEGILAESGKHLPPVKVVRHEHNQGPSAARNTAVACSNGELILPLDADDLLEPDYLELTLKALKGKNVGGAYTDIDVFGDQNFIHHADCTPSAIMRMRGGSVTFLYKREVFDSVGGYKTKFRLAEDKDFWLSAYARGWQFVRVPKPLLRYRRHSRSLTANMDGLLLEAMLQLFHEHKNFYKDKIEEWFPDKEREHLEVVDNYDKLYAQWQIDHDNYCQLEAAFKVLSAQHEDLKLAHAQLVRRMTLPQRIQNRFLNMLAKVKPGKN